MVREMVTVQVGQCGNQIGRRFWAELLHEAAAQQQASGGAGGGTYDAAMSAFFRNVDARYEPPAELALVTDVSGAGNNWGHGYGEYGPKYGDEIEAAASAALERCDSPQAFFFLHSVGGGTGSGLGSAVLERFVDAFPDLCRFSVAVYPGGDDETSGGLNIDVNEIATNLVPFPRLHYLTASYAPLLPRDFGGGAAAAPDRGGGDDRARHPRHVQRLFADAASPLSRLVATYDAQPARPAATLAVALARRVAPDVAAPRRGSGPSCGCRPGTRTASRSASAPCRRSARAARCSASRTRRPSRGTSPRSATAVKLYRAKAGPRANFIDGALFDGPPPTSGLVGDYELAEQRPAALYAPPRRRRPTTAPPTRRRPPAPPSVLL
ncbi:hypothetical protein JL720_11395 [Aureococcus anophagefferens]|nr:hypothetical protein JL720_11395 [Aureococcus anophagefferens]